MIGAVSAAAAQTTQSPAAADANQADSKSVKPSARKADKAAAYYHYTLAHMYEEMVTS